MLGLLADKEVGTIKEAAKAIIGRNLHISDPEGLERAYKDYSSKDSDQPSVTNHLKEVLYARVGKNHPGNRQAGL